MLLLFLGRLRLIRRVARQRVVGGMMQHWWKRLERKTG
jgi:hypothetical protein